ncbi:hypothetical protein MG293_014722 [Ovis ammon polii]|uniref:Uncharacterized protein n=1 Tax=Ovis ammon polii TaxID=230172 RepID=A0AAD4Y6N6_OVIAM|nr:hypothetical protein MG293_014722 [Ovis ammon polii]
MRGASSPAVRTERWHDDAQQNCLFTASPQHPARRRYTRPRYMFSHRFRMEMIPPREAIWHRNQSWGSRRRLTGQMQHWQRASGEVCVLVEHMAPGKDDLQADDSEQKPSALTGNPNPGPRGRKSRFCQGRGPGMLTARVKGPQPNSGSRRTSRASPSVLCFPGGSVAKNPPANVGDMGLIPDREHSARYGTTKPMCRNYQSSCALEPRLRNKRCHRNEKPVHHNQRNAPARCNYRQA